MCPQLPRLSPEYSHKAGLQTVITGMPLQIRPVTRGGHAGPVTMGRIARGPLSWTRPHCGMTSSPVFVWCRSSEKCPCLFCLCQTSGTSEGFERRVASLSSPQQFGLLKKDCDFYSGLNKVWLDFKYIFEIYQRNPIYISLLCCWVL
jgi:hypothetical protein